MEKTKKALYTMLVRKYPRVKIAVSILWDIVRCIIKKKGVLCYGKKKKLVV